ncbi:MAG: SusC/RagA family TonB-linked outer membrane protein [Bacteroidales bacterium]|nr:SusC/RagA family TonB-linked outer membrane protein [Bacteroidales bacterium]MBN2697194.1 SusC/RagA family TonB-linked outer membrane protein [Bacteroidales bacterium]
MKRNHAVVILSVALGWLLYPSLMSQAPTLVRGTVTSAVDGSPLPGATVVEMDQNNRILKGTVTDIDGNYVLSISSGSNTIQFSFVGYQAQTYPIENRSVINVEMSEDALMIEGVEIIAQKRINTGFMEVEDRSLAIPVERISAAEIEEVQASSIDEALQGRMAGVDIVSNSGDPGGGMSIRIRGVSTLNANDRPLIVVDNVPYETNIASDFDFATANEEGYAQMLNIAVDDIREITVLKDAAATALWGTKAANGVLSITTKRGMKSLKPRVAYTYRATISFKPEPIPMLSGDQYSTLIAEGVMNVDGIPLNTMENKEFLYDPSEPYWYYNYGQNTNWLNEITRTGYINNHDFSLTGGGEKAKYRFSVNYQNQKGVTLGTGLKRFTTRLNLDYDISDKLRLSADLAYAHGFSERSFRSDLRSVAYRKMPNMAVYEFDENGNETPVFNSPESNIQGSYSGTYNPVAMAESSIYNTINDRIMPKFSLNYRIVKGLTYNFDIAFDINNTKRNYFLPQIATGRPWTDLNVNRASESDEDTYYIYTNNRLTYSNTFNNIHQLTATINFQTNDTKGIQYQSTTANSASSEFQDPSIPARIQEGGLSISSDSWQNRDNGIIGLVHYSLLDRYIISGGIRREGNSRFDENFRYGFYPSLSFAWRLSGEKFMSSYTWLDDLRIKASYGENGYAPRYPYIFFNNYSTFPWSYLGSTAVYPVDMQLKELKWETFITKNLGFTLEMFNSRFMMDFDIYQNATRDMFGYNVAIASSSGYDGILMNVGSLDNQGWDFSVRTYPVRKGDLSVSLDFNVARNYNILREVADDYPLERGRTTSNGEYKRIIQVGNPIGSFYGYRFLGVYKDWEDLIAIDENGDKIYNANGEPVYMVYNYPAVNYEFQPGDAKYEDINHDGNINYLDVIYLGDANPDFTGGFGSSVKYKGFAFNVFFYGRYGNEIINQTKMYGENMFSYDNQTTATLRRWRQPGDETDMPRALIGYGYNWLGSDRYVDDGSFLRMKYLTFTYYLPKRLTEKWKISQMRMSVTINNLLTFTNYLGQDPEININSRDGTIYTVGYDTSNTPRPKEVTLNLNVNF